MCWSWRPSVTNEWMEEQTNIKVVKTYSLFATTFWPGWFLHWLLGDFSSPWRANTRQCKKISLTSDQRVMESWCWHLNWVWEVYIHIRIIIETTTRTCYMYGKMCIEGLRNCQFMRMVTNISCGCNSHSIVKWWLGCKDCQEVLVTMQYLKFQLATSLAKSQDVPPQVGPSNDMNTKKTTCLDSENQLTLVLIPQLQFWFP